MIWVCEQCGRKAGNVISNPLKPAKFGDSRVARCPHCGRTTRQLAKKLTLPK